ncbi:DUF2637 domain-containing protein [Streptomyces sp. NPDC001584]|uniref:DUF2637 domain-containing protein n=1 Tax=Streptomyces sp. NPDC001584 TaxID=3154521 RepID=UPI003323E5C3
MDLSKAILPAGIGLAALCALAIVALILRSRRGREQDRMSAEDRERLAEERRKSWRRRLAVISLGVAFVIIFCIAGIAAWLSFGAQKAYAFDRNGGSWDAAMGFALLLDAGALGLSLLRLFEALTARSSQMTRLYLIAFIVASATMNLLHAPHSPGEAPSLGGRLVAVIPPLVYAIFLETLLKKVEQLVLGKYPKRKIKKNVERGYSLLLWVPFVGYPWQMWKQWRKDLHDTLQYVRAPGSRNPLPAPAAAAGTGLDEEEVAPRAGFRPAAPEALRAAPAPRAATAPREPRPVPAQHTPAAAPVAEPSGAAAGAIGAPVLTPAPGPSPAAFPSPVQPQPVQAAASPQPADQPALPPVPSPRAPVENLSKKDMLREALAAQIRSGDLRVLDDNAQISNGAAYRANMQLGKQAGEGLDPKGAQKGLLAPGAVRAAVKQLLPDLRQLAQEVERARAEASVRPPAPEPVPDHRPLTDEDAPANADVSRGRRDQEEPVIGHQRDSEPSVEEKETVLA